MMQGFWQMRWRDPDARDRNERLVRAIVHQEDLKVEVFKVGKREVTIRGDNDHVARVVECMNKPDYTINNAKSYAIYMGHL